MQLNPDNSTRVRPGQTIELRNAHRELMSRRGKDVGFYDVPAGVRAQDVRDLVAWQMKLAGAPQEADRALVDVVAVDPVEAVG